jgi:hypothetical protein
LIRVEGPKLPESNNWMLVYFKLSYSVDYILELGTVTEKKGYSRFNKLLENY